jgi:hypothetical protein
MHAFSENKLKDLSQEEIYARRGIYMTYRPVVCVRFVVWSRTCSRPDPVVVVVLLTCSAPGRPKQAGGVCTSGIIVLSVHRPPHDLAFQPG